MFVITGLLSSHVAALELPKSQHDSDFHKFSEEQAQLGQLLFYDAILSGNRNISCGTCHNHAHGSADGLALGVGEGGVGLGPQRSTGSGTDRILKRIPRNAPGLWNVGAKEYVTFFLDGRVSHADFYNNRFNTPAQEWLPQGLNSLLAAQALFPLTSQFEMAGDPGENQVAGAVYDRIDAVWPILAKRVRIIPQYGEMFVTAFADINKPEQITISHIANAIAAFEALEWRSTDSPFDAYLQGQKNALTQAQQRGMTLFYGAADCHQCHSGPLLTDHQFHALGLPQFGPGRTRQWDMIVRDLGRMSASDRFEDAYRFRTPSLRNVALTAPYGHNGAYPTLEGIVRHHLNPQLEFASWRPEMVDLPVAAWLQKTDFMALEDSRERQRVSSTIDIQPQQLQDHQVADIVAFLNALTGTASVNGRLGKPKHVPSGLEVD
ncbi:MAG: methylamine utilization protein MauG [Gammaproteobacteria bacterium]|nr:methylamine utilization protein MauG [Gammaproteobacteria bacterium]MCP4879438.1 methylamine utilization protein MauG [Gammaproteobacteria bacterium]MDP6189698.1 cytochrome c peroxidase [Gammaproteobacteria bacterium]